MSLAAQSIGKLRRSGVGAYGLIFAFYVGTGPVYWLPGMSLSLMFAIKAFAYISIVAVPFMQSVELHRVKFPGGMVAFVAVLSFLFLSFPSLLTGDGPSAAYQLQNTLQIILFLYASGFLMKKGLIRPVMYLSVKFFFVSAVISIFLILIMPNYPNPLNSALTISQTGLGGSRTGWSPAIALYLPWLYSAALFPSLLAVVVGIFMLANQFLVAGRTGMVATAVPFLVWPIIEKKRKVVIAVAIISAAVLVYVANNLASLRLDIGDLGSIKALNDFSSSRWEQYVVALKAIADKPVFGFGVRDVWYGGEEWYIHNTILRFAAEGGVMLAASILVLFVLPVYRGWRKIKKGDLFVIPALLTVLSGIVSSMFEPGFMFGSFNGSPFWWLCFSVCVSKNIIYTQEVGS